MFKINIQVLPVPAIALSLMATLFSTQAYAGTCFGKRAHVDVRELESELTRTGDYVVISGITVTRIDEDGYTFSIDALEAGGKVIIGSNQNDRISGGRYDGDDDYICGANGHDSINGYNGDNELAGGNGNDSISTWSRSAHNLVKGGNDNDLITALGPDVLQGGNGHDTFRLTWHRAEVHGGDGNDYVYFNFGDDYRIWGDDDADYIEAIFNSRTSPVGLKIYGGDGKDFISMEAITRPEGKNLLDGGNDKDIIHGGSASDTIIGGSGDDLLWSGAGFDSIDGGPGTDFLYDREWTDIFVNNVEHSCCL